MSIAQERSEAAVESPPIPTVDLKLEVVVLPVADVGRAAEFYGGLGWRQDADVSTGDRRVLQFTPPGSPCSIIFATPVKPGAGGGVQFLHLAVSDIERAREALIAKGVDVSEVFHDAAGGYNPFEPQARASGPDPGRRSYLSFATFSDPDGNGWLLQEIRTRLPGR
jgi:catechol 2,3-dioxygenase-like lactoylglutathione lyase family enzyme